MKEIDAYFAAQPEPQRSTLLETWRRFAAVLPDGVEAMSYGMPTLKLNGKAIGSIAGFKAHCSFFPHTGSLFESIEQAVAKYETSRGTLKFSIDHPLPKTVLKALVRAKIRQIEERSA